jgi:DNA helicase HerA-like ATPase
VIGSIDPFGLVPYRLPHSARPTHTYVIGITGKGKSKLLEHCLFQDITSGRGCGLLDPHSDLANDTLRYLASHPRAGRRYWERIVYFEPTRPDYQLPFNVLASGFSPYETAQNIVEAFQRTWPKTLDEAPRFANIALVAILTLIANGRTLIDLPRLLTNPDFRRDLLADIRDPEILSFWEDRYDRWGREQPLMIESILNKVTAFTLNPYLRTILGASQNRLRFREIMDEGKVFIADLGRCDGETRRLLGSLIVTGLEQAALSRKDQAEARTPFYFYVDEFQDFCANEGSAKTFAQILSECRKFGLHLTLAHQTLTQLGVRMRGALGNIQTKIVFGIEREDAEIMAKRLFSVDGEEVKHEVDDAGQQERTHPVFYSLPEQWEKTVAWIQDLPARAALVRAPGRGVAQIKTILVKDRACTSKQLHPITRHLARQSGEPAAALAANRELRSAPQSTEVVDWEADPTSTCVNAVSGA